MPFIVRTCMAALLLFAWTPDGSAQQGHPLDGTWYGDWGPSDTHRNPVVVVIRYDGESLSGLINPGPDSVPIEVITLDHTDWTVHIEASTVNASGRVVRFVVDGQIQDLGLPNRSMTGTWDRPDARGDFQLTRN